MMSLDTLLEHLDAGQPLVTGTDAFDCMHAYSYEAMRLPCTAGVGLALDRIYHLTRADRDWLAGVVARMAKEEETAEMTQGETPPMDE